MCAQGVLGANTRLWLSSKTCIAEVLNNLQYPGLGLFGFTSAFRPSAKQTPPHHRPVPYYAALFSGAMASLNMTGVVADALRTTGQSPDSGKSAMDCASFNKLAACAAKLIPGRLTALMAETAGRVTGNRADVLARYDPTTSVASLDITVDLTINVLDAIGDLITSV